jgi:hypothetical protein
MSIIYVKNRRERRTALQEPVADDALPEEDPIVPIAKESKVSDTESISQLKTKAEDELTEDQRYYVDLAEALDL